MTSQPGQTDMAVSQPIIEFVGSETTITVVIRIWHPTWGHAIACGTDCHNDITIFASDGRLLQTLSGHTDYVQCIVQLAKPMSFLHDIGRPLISGTLSDNTLIVWT